jgi:hydrogenase-4 component E
VSGAAVWLCVALGLAALTARRRSVAIGAVTAQAAVLAALALAHDAPAEERVGTALALVVRGAVLAVALLLVVRRTRETRPVRASLGPLPRAALGIGLALLLAALVPELGLESRDVERAALALAAFGLAAAAVRRATLFQIVGLVLLENGLVLAALGVPGGASVAIELGAALDLVLVGVVAVAFHRRIFAEFGAADTARLRSLRD